MIIIVFIIFVLMGLIVISLNLIKMGKNERTRSGSDFKEKYERGTGFPSGPKKSRITYVYQRTHTWPDGTKYDGEWKDGNKHGKGIFTWPDGEKYEGEWKDGKFHGRGIYTWPDGTKYDGEWKDDKKHGKGVYTFHSGAKYEGEFKDDKYHGIGVYTYSDGEKYEGEFKDGERWTGTYYSKDGTTSENKDGKEISRKQI